MAKGTKTAPDAPALRMRVTPRGLEPVTAYDAERLGSYRNGSEMWVHPTQEINVALRKFWAVLGKVVRDCQTPWKNTTQAADSLKLSLGHTHQFKDQAGRWRQAPRSLTEFSLPEMEEFNLKVWEVLEAVTGVDPLTMQAEAPMSDAPQTPLEPEPSMGAEADSMDGKPDPEAKDPAPVTNQPDPEEIKPLIRECATKFWANARDLALTAVERRGAMELMLPSWKAALPTRLDTVRNLMITADRVITEKITAEAGRTLIAGYAGMTEEEFK